MPKNQFRIWSEVVDIRNDKDKEKYALTDAEINTIKRIMCGDTSNGINLHKLKDTHPAVFSAYANDTDRLLFIVKGTTLILIGKTPHKYDTAHALQPGVAERFYQKPWDTIKDTVVEYETITELPDFTPNPNYVYQTPEVEFTVA